MNHDWLIGWCPYWALHIFDVFVQLEIPLTMLPKLKCNHHLMISTRIMLWQCLCTGGYPVTTEWENRDEKQNYENFLIQYSKSTRNKQKANMSRMSDAVNSPSTQSQGRSIAQECVINGQEWLSCRQAWLSCRQACLPQVSLFRVSDAVKLPSAYVALSDAFL